MEQEKNNWIEEVMNSHVDKKKLKLSKSLFDSIPRVAIKSRTISLKQMAIAGVAASLLVIVNTIAIQNLNSTVKSRSVGIAYDDQFISDYNIYQYE